MAQHRLLREPLVRHRSRLPDVLLEARAAAQPARGRAAGRPAPGAVGLRPVRGPGRRAGAAEHRAAGDARQRRHHAEAVPVGCRQLRPQAEARRALHDDPRAVLLRLRPRRADRPLRREHRALGRAQGLYDHQPALPARRGGLDPRDAQPARRSGFGRRLDQPRQRRHPRDDVGHPRPQGLPVQPRCTGSPAGRLHVQDLRVGHRGDEEDRSLVDVLRLGAVHLSAGSRTSPRGRFRRTTIPTRAGHRSRARRFAPTTPSLRS